MYFRRSGRSLRRSVRIDGACGGNGDDTWDGGEGDVSERRPAVLELSCRRRLDELDMEPLWPLY